MGRVSATLAIDMDRKDLNPWKLGHEQVVDIIFEPRNEKGLGSRIVGGVPSVNNKIEYERRYDTFDSGLSQVRSLKNRTG